MTRKHKLSILIIAFILSILLCFSSMITSGKKVEADEDVRYTKKVVSVLFDNSGSMFSYNEVSGMSYALYSLQMLISSMNSQDILQIVPLNKKSKYSAVANNDYVYKVDLANTDRGRAIRDTVNNTVINDANGDTPGDVPMTCAINSLKAQGLKSVSDKETSPDGVEYWLVVLTDGKFTESDYSSTIGTAKFVHDYVKDYQSLKTVYIAFGDSANDLTGYNTDIPFTPYKVSSMDGIISTMQKVTGQMSGRYSLDKRQYSVSGNKVTINLNSIEYSLRGISVIAQNCNAVLNGVTYNGATVPVSIGSVIEPNSDLSTTLKMKAGYSAVIDGNPYFSGGELILTYSNDVDANALAIYVEPALRIEMYLEYQDGSTWKETDMQYINSHLTSKDKIRVGYRVHEQVKGKLVDVAKIFGSSKMEVTYAGKNYSSSNTISDEINLVVGKKEISVTVNVSINKDFDDYSYEMRANMMCIIEQNPTYYRVEGLYEGRVGGNPLNHKITYTVYADNSPITYSELSKYNYSIMMHDESGNEIPITASSNSSGKIISNISLPTGNYGTYTIDFEIKSEDNITRKHEQTFYYYPENVIINSIGDGDFSLTQHALKNSSKSVKFEVLTDGGALSLNNSFISYKVDLNGKDITAKCQVDGNMVEFIPSEEVVSEVGDKKVTLTVSTDKGVALKQTCSVDFSLLPTVYKLDKLDYETEKIDIYDLPNCKSVIYFKPTIDDVSLSKEEIEELISIGNISLKHKEFGFTLLLPCDVEMVCEEYNGEPVIAVRAVGKWNKTLSSLFAAFIFDGDKDVEVSYNGVKSSGAFVLEEVTCKSRLIRFGILALILLAIIYLLLYVIGFFKTNERMLPKGVFVVYNVNSSSDKIKPILYKVNMKFGDRLKWHLARLIPFVKFPFKYQSSYTCNKIIELIKSGKSNIQFKFKQDVVKVDLSGREEYKNDFENYKQELSLYVCGQIKEPRRYDIPLNQILNIVQRNSFAEEIKKDTLIGVSDGIFAQFNDERQLTKVIYFVFKRY